MSLIPLIGGPSWLTYFGSVALAGALLGVGGFVKGCGYEKDKEAVRVAKATQATLLAEREGARMAFRLQEAKDADSLRIAGWLADAQQRLRDRPARVQRTSPSTCQGSTGADLSGPDSGFLAGEAARADELRTALGQCQQWIESTRGAVSK